MTVPAPQTGTPVADVAPKTALRALSPAKSTLTSTSSRVPPAHSTVPTLVPTEPYQVLELASLLNHRAKAAPGRALPTVIPTEKVYPLIFFLILEGPEQAETLVTVNKVEVG